MNVKLNLAMYMLGLCCVTPKFTLKLLLCKRGLRQLIPINFAILVRNFFEGGSDMQVLQPLIILPQSCSCQL